MKFLNQYKRHAMRFDEKLLGSLFFKKEIITMTGENAGEMFLQWMLK